MRPGIIVTAVVAAVFLAVTASAPAAPLPLAPNDPGWAGQWGLRLIGIPQVWQAARPDAHPLIATVDTGVDSTFPDLRNVVQGGWNLVGNDADTSDVAGHGTDVAIVIAAQANNHYGIAGACPMCRVMPVKISLDRTAPASMLATGIRWAVDHGARIVVVSLVHTGAPDPAEQPAVDYATAHGAIVIASAGNDSGTEPHYPAASPGAVAVAATDTRDGLYPWATHGDWVALTAPGCEYGAEMCGASYAPPLVAGAVGVLMAASPAVTPLQALDALRATAVHVDGVAGGRIDVLAAARLLGLVAAAPPPFQRQLQIQNGSFGRHLSTTVFVAAGALTIVLTRPHADLCGMALRSRSGIYLASSGIGPRLTLRATVAGGRYVLAVTCPGRAAPLPYSLAVRGLLATG